MTDPAKEQEYREEAERLAQLPRDAQRKIVALYQTYADNPRSPRRERDFARERVEALERHLRRLNRRKKES